MTGRDRFLTSVAGSSRLLNEVSPRPKLSSCDTQGGPGADAGADAGTGPVNRDGGFDFGEFDFLWHTAHTDSVLPDSGPTRSNKTLVSIAPWPWPWQCQQCPYLKALAPSMPVVEVADALTGGASVCTSTVPEASPEREARPSRPPSIIASKRRPSSSPSMRGDTAKLKRLQSCQEGADE